MISVMELTCRLGWIRPIWSFSSHSAMVDCIFFKSVDCFCPIANFWNNSKGKGELMINAWLRPLMFGCRSALTVWKPCSCNHQLLLGARHGKIAMLLSRISFSTPYYRVFAILQHQLHRFLSFYFRKGHILQGVEN